MDVERRLEIADRHVWNAIHEMIQRDPLKALVELVTNADDSYARLEAAGERPTGRIVVEIEEHRGGAPSVLRVRDDAEGFTLEGLDRCVGRMGEATSRQDEVERVRGMWGDGLKEALLGLGVGGTVHAVRAGAEVWASLSWGADLAPIYRRPAMARGVDAARRQALDLEGDGTVVEAQVAPHIAVPRHGSLVHQIGLHYALRDIVRSPARRVVVRRVSEGRVLHEDRVTFADPVADPALEVDERWPIPGFPGASFTLSLRRSEVALTGFEAGPSRLSGVLVQSRGALVDIGWFGHEHRVGAEHLFGRVGCDALTERLREGDLTLTRNRTGLNRDNAFARALIAAIEARSDRWLSAEARRHEGLPTAPAPWLRSRMRGVVAELNRIFASERRRIGRERVAGPFAFERMRYLLRLGESRDVHVRVAAGALPPGAVVSFSVDGEGIALVGPTSVTFAPDGAPPAARVRAVAASGGLIRATAAGHQTSARVRVHAPDVEALGFEEERLAVEVGRDTVALLWSSAALAERSLEVSAESGGLRVISVQADAEPAGGWLSSRVVIRGDQVGARDVLVARVGAQVTRLEVEVVARREHAGPGGPVVDVVLDEQDDPPQRALFRASDGVVVLFVNERGVRRYLAEPDARATPLGRAMLAEMLLHAICEELALRHAAELQGAAATDPVGMGLHLVDDLTHRYGDRVHAALNPP